MVRSVSPGYVLMAVDAPRTVGEKTDDLDPIVGAFLSFTMSQAGMVAHWRRAGGRGSGGGETESVDRAVGL